MDGVMQATALSVLAMAFALLIERLLEVLKSLYDVIDSHFDFYPYWTDKAKRVANFMERRRRVFELIDPKAEVAFLNRFSEMLLQRPGGGTGAIPVISGDLLRSTYVRVAAKVLGMVLGISVALLVKLDLLALYQEAAGGNWVIDHLSPASRLIGTGIVIGLGSSPVHKLITAIEQKREAKNGGGGGGGAGGGPNG